MWFLKLIPWALILVDVIIGFMAYYKVWYFSDPNVAIITLFWLLIVTCCFFALKLIPVLKRFF